MTLTSQTYKKTLTTTLDVTDLPHCPQAVLIEICSQLAGGDITTNEFILPRAALERAEASGDVIEYITKSRPYDTSLPDVAGYDLIPAHWLAMSLNDLDGAYNYGKGLPPVRERAEDAAYVPVFFSGWDGTVWDIEGRQLNLAFTVECGSSFVDVHAAAEALADDERVLSCEIDRTPYYNADSVGTYTMTMTVQLTDEDVARLQSEKKGDKPLTRNDVNSMVGRMYWSGPGDILGLARFPSKEARNDSDNDDDSDYPASW